MMKKIILTAGIFLAAFHLHAQVKDTVEQRAFDSLDSLPPADTPEVFIETVAEFEGGVEMMYLFLAKRIQYPKAARRKKITGKVISQFIVNTDGTMEDITIVKSDCDCFNEEVIRVLKLMPPWKPATQNGKPVRIKYTLPVRFNLD